jgi:Zn-dependent peptidase ImmA (M78 family)
MTIANNRKRFSSGRRFADYFAAALLMPELAFRKAINRHDPGLTCIEVLRKDCETSLTATAIRFARLTRDGIAVILSSGEVSIIASCPKGSKRPNELAGFAKARSFLVERRPQRLMLGRKT